MDQRSILQTEGSHKIFCLFGVGGVGAKLVIQLGADALFLEVFHFIPWLSYLIALVLSVLWNFTLNRKFTFQSAANVPVAMLKVLGYYLVFAPVSTILGNFLAEGLSWNAYLVEFLMMLLNFVTEFLFQRFFVFGKSIDTAK